MSLELDPISSCSKHVNTLQGFQSCNEGMLENPTIKFSYGSLDSRRSPVDGHFKNVKQDMWLHKDKNNVMICIWVCLGCYCGTLELCVHEKVVWFLAKRASVNTSWIVLAVALQTCWLPYLEWCNLIGSAPSRDFEGRLCHLDQHGTFPTLWWEQVTWSDGIRYRW